MSHAGPNEALLDSREKVVVRRRLLTCR